MKTRKKKVIKKRRKKGNKNKTREIRGNTSKENLGEEYNKQTTTGELLNLKKNCSQPGKNIKKQQQKFAYALSKDIGCSIAASIDCVRAK